MHPPSTPEHSGFDSAAPHYDREFESSPATARLRKIILETAIRFFRPEGNLLELNCGTGTDAIMLAQRGFRVLATDASPAMLRQAERKIVQSNLSERIQLEPLAFDGLASISCRTFDGGFSNMGGLNCIPRLEPVSNALSKLIRPGGIFVACFISDFCLWETSAFLSRGQLRRAFRRRTPGRASVTVHGQQLKVYFFSPREVERQFSAGFRTVSLMGLNIFSPPPSSRGAYRLLGNAVRLLELLDNVVSDISPFNRIGDHFLMVLERKDD